ncbi:trypsin-like serine protease [Streptomyces sp. LBUM 1478]|nr:trypsin-like serine protease [Streptomyces sp. LBUM 1484]MBP5878448.1 trypsin-like serine protease [Streptomyces sp. LBUM 1477]MBP5886290.1 trypsin-like serine protease [Streptomyces sp. LBUM 1487]MBP5891008.1 trypsin-like serine protease [Streptomyces sp. LBUM 1481]MBP5902270.1 trypsin-like serine protease [Streptomyces sp. LBUM 1488]MBP5908320.1 trypsin-like serine protease [Streptomyces sp. LBUM 1478]MBP5914099.1 trypsin-like serine protease [Streptomyces sp. LBUM 1486]MBP5921152.1 try
MLLTSASGVSADTGTTPDALDVRIAKAMAAGDSANANLPERQPSSSASSDGGLERSAQIIGGSTTTIGSAPWMAQLWYYDPTQDLGFFCGGSVVSPTKILTAAHCVDKDYFDWVKYGEIITGTDQLPTAVYNDDGTLDHVDYHGGTRSTLTRQWNHSSWDEAAIDNDVAVLTLSAPVKATPIKMTTSDDTASYKAGTSAKAYGWGRTSSKTDDISQKLKTATLPIVSDTTCGATWDSYFIKGHMVCAGKPAGGTDATTTATCNGDSGGPLVVNNKVVGVVSWGVIDCVAKGAYPVFAKVSKYVGATYPRVDDAAITRDGKADVFLRNKETGTGYVRASTGSKLGDRASLSSNGSWTGYNLVQQTDLNRDGYQDFVLRRSSDGDVFWRRYVPSSKTWTTTQIFDDWKTRTRIITPGDVTGDALPDVLSVDSAGSLWIYPGKGTGSFGTRVKVSTGWNSYNAVLGHGDFTGDGKADLIARTKTGSNIYLFKGTGKSGTGAFAAKIKVRSDWSSYNTLITPGDVSGDGRADLLARTPAGTLYLYKGTGKATSEIFGTRGSVGSSYAQYDLLG